MKYVLIKNFRINLDQILGYHPFEKYQTILNKQLLWRYIAFRTNNPSSDFDLCFEGNEKEHQAALELLDYYASAKKEIE